MSDGFYDFSVTTFDEEGKLSYGGSLISGLDELKRKIDACINDPNIKTVYIECYDKEEFLKKYGEPYPLPSSFFFNTCRYSWWGELFSKFEVKK